MNNCIFCKIINNEIPSYTLYEDEIVKVFLDINPERPGHTLIIPKNHYIDINDIPIETLLYSGLSAGGFALCNHFLKKKLNYDGLRIIQNNGVLEEVKHYHLHLIPFYQDNFSKSVEEIYEILQN